MALRKQRLRVRYERALRDKIAVPAQSLAVLAKTHSLDTRSLQRRWRRYEHAVAAADPHPIDTASEDCRGGSNRTFTAVQETMLADMALCASPAWTHTQLRSAAMQLERDVRVAQHGSVRVLRRRQAFVASPRFITGLKRRQRLSSHRNTVRFVGQQQMDTEAREHDILEFVNDVRTAIDKYGAHRVLNMDETPVSKVEHAITGIVRTGSDRAAQITTKAGNRLNVTHFPCITAAGNKLQMCAVIKGKTLRTLTKITKDASLAVQRVRLYYSISGWINSAIIVRWLAEVVQPFTKSEPAALVMDDFAAHWTDEVKEAALAIKLQLICVPKGTTSEYQPLDARFNGPMTKARQRLWTQQRMLHPDSLDSFQQAVERASQAYDSLSQHSTQEAWRAAFLLD